MSRTLIAAVVLLWLLLPLCADAQRAAERVNILIYRCIDQRDAGKYEDALASMLKARDLMPRDPEVWRFLGEAYKNLGQGVDAIVALRKAIELGSEEDWDRTTLTNLLWEEAMGRQEAGQLDDAERLLTEALRYSPEDANVLSTLGDLYRFDRDDPLGAIPYYRRAVAADPDDGYTRTNYASCLYRDLQRYDEAERQCREGLARAGTDADAAESLCSVLVPLLVRKDNYTEAAALEDTMSARGADYGYPFGNAMAERARELALAGETDRALQVALLADARPYYISGVPDAIALALRLRDPQADLATLEAEATRLCRAPTAAAVGAGLAMTAVATTDRGERAIAGMLLGREQVCVLAAYEAGWEPLDVGSLGSTVLFISMMMPEGAVLIMPEMDQQVIGDWRLRNGAGVSVVGAPASLFGEAPDPEAPIVCPLTDAAGRSLLDPNAGYLAFSGSLAGGGAVEFRWPLPLKQSELALVAWRGLRPESRRLVRFHAAQVMWHPADGAVVVRMLPEEMPYLPDDERAAMLRAWESYEVGALWIDGVDPLALASRTRLVTAGGARVRGQAPDAELWGTLQGYGEWGVPFEPAEEGYIVFPLLSPGGRSVLSDADRVIRIEFVGPDGATVLHSWEFPRSVESLPLE